MSYDYSENILVQESAGHLLERELGWEVAYAYNTEKLGEKGTFGRKDYKEILLTRYFRQALKSLNLRKRWKAIFRRRLYCKSTRQSIA